MAVVRIEVDFDVDLKDGVTSAGAARVELDDPSGDLPALLERAQGAMLRLLPQKTTKAPESEVIIKVDNIQFTDAASDTFFGYVRPNNLTWSGGGEGSNPGQTKARGQCQDSCPKTGARCGPCRCGLPLGHRGAHIGDFGCRWGDAPAPAEKGQCQDRCPTDEAGHPPCRCELPLGHEGKHRALSTGHGWPDAAEPLRTCGHLMEFENCPKPKGHAGAHVDNGRCAACCPEEHERPEQCRLQRGHRGAHESDRPWGERCAWGGSAEAELQQCDDRVHWMGKAYHCNRNEGHPDHHENAEFGYRWEIDGALEICGGTWEEPTASRYGLACRLPEGHDGDCGPLPPGGESMVERADCA